MPADSGALVSSFYDSKIVSFRIYFHVVGSKPAATARWSSLPANSTTGKQWTAEGAAHLVRSKPAATARRDAWTGKYAGNETLEPLLTWWGRSRRQWRDGARCRRPARRPSPATAGASGCADCCSPSQRSTARSPAPRAPVQLYKQFRHLRRRRSSQVMHSLCCQRRSSHQP